MDPQKDDLLERVVAEGYNPKVEELRRTEYPQLQGNGVMLPHRVLLILTLLLRRYHIS